MSIISPPPSGSRGQVILQPSYFTSSVFVKALRDDVSTLLQAFDEKYTNNPSVRPFSLFKDLWSSQGWNLMHLMVFDNRARQAFLNTVIRLFIERTIGTTSLYNKASALFGFYTFFYTQPRGAAPSLYDVAHVPIQLDHYISLKELPGLLDTEHLQPFQFPVSHVLSTLLKDEVFFIVPWSTCGPLNPRDLPREFIDNDSAPLMGPNAPKKKGRPTKRDKAKRARSALDGLDSWLDRTVRSAVTSVPTPTVMTHPLTMSLNQYQLEKSSLLDNIDVDQRARQAAERANRFVLDRLREAADQLEPVKRLSPPRYSDNASLARVERALVEPPGVTGDKWRGGILSLLGGEGTLQTQRG